ncbi:hypothetical protein [Segatella bryantii]|uniref:hypothetical protein n=1 Tax=Segatella bryantii TaxID=77095 RepID=UPI00242AF019|nr:hypothetical protein [Segatella bryantii]
MSSPSPFDEGKKRNNVDLEIAALVTSDASVLFSVLVDDHPMFYKLYNFKCRMMNGYSQAKL